MLLFCPSLDLDSLSYYMHQRRDLESPLKFQADTAELSLTMQEIKVTLTSLH